MFDAHRPLIEAYRVVDVRSPGGDLAPPEIAERFEGRLFTLHQLEQRGVRIQGRAAWTTGSSRRLPSSGTTGSMAPGLAPASRRRAWIVSGTAYVSTLK